MARHAPVYLLINGIMQALARPAFIALLDHLPYQETSVLKLLEKASIQCRFLIEAMKEEFNELSKGETEDQYRLAKTTLATFEFVEKQMKTYQTDISNLEESLTNLKNCVPSLEQGSVKQQYEGFLGKLRFDVGESSMLEHHHYQSLVGQTQPSRTKILRLAQEQSALANSLPISYESSVFVRVDPNHMDVLQVLIAAPDDTPYASGCFLFDVYFPSDYPSSPPKMNLMTTGGGTVRFNPNLYNCGKVCLSLLGTWGGAAGETWNKETSTFLQAVVSIQSLIFVKMPYFNEPGYEKEIGTPLGSRLNKDYNEPLRVATIQHAMVGQLRSPPPGFETVIKAHFYFKRNSILDTCADWLEEASSNKHRYSQLLYQVRELRKELSTLQAPY